MCPRERERERDRERERERERDRERGGGGRGCTYTPHSWALTAQHYNLLPYPSNCVHVCMPERVAKRDTSSNTSTAMPPFVPAWTRAAEQVEVVGKERGRERERERGRGRKTQCTPDSLLN